MEPGEHGPDAELVAALVALRAAVGEVRLPLELAEAPHQRLQRAQVLDQLDDYLLPRARAAGAPLLVVVGGSTGAGKSTLVNSLLGEQVSQAGVLRPTTRAPVLVHHPLDTGWFRGDRVLPGLARITGTGAVDGAGALRLVASQAVPPGLALLDAPDIDSVVQDNRRLATQLLGAADLWLFVTTAARYADAVPWDLLEAAERRHTELALVLDRVDPGTEGPVRAHLEQMLAEHGLGSAPVLLVAEAPLEDGLLPEHVVAPVADWLTALGADPAERAAAITRTREGTTADLLVRARGLADAADAQRAADGRLRAMVATPYNDALETVLRATSDGTMLRGEVLARWQDVVGTGEFFRAVETRVGWLRDRLTAAIRGRGAPEPELATAIGHGLEAVVLDAAEDAAGRAHAAWHADPAGAALLGGLQLARGSSDLRARVAGEIRAWQSDVLELVAEEGASKRSTARVLSFGVNGLGAALMVAVFASTGGLTGAEIGIAGGSALLAQRVLEAVFGDDAVRQLTRTAHERLAVRIRGVLAGQSERYTVQLDALGTAHASGTELRQAADRVARAMVRLQEAVGGGEGAGAGTGTPTAGAAVPGTARGALRGAGAGRPAPVTPDRDAPTRRGTGAGARADSGATTESSGDGGLRGWWRRLLRGPEDR
ncbi:ABC transporter [Cellulomonas fimi]|uniref:ABC transporter n=1 Tax=Cellulomonas fimi TaxID=1708 RepID=A0A7Y0LWS5_CELFI|nr:ABC transporter [Cellulomonas fimi]NMR19662.1 ABC transporter [Cellulomonas fimi]